MGTGPWGYGFELQQTLHPDPLPKGEGTEALSLGLSRRQGGQEDRLRQPALPGRSDLRRGVATAQGLRFLQTLGFQCKAFCGARLDVSENIETMLRRHEVVYRHGTIPLGNAQAPLLVASLGGFARGGAAPIRWR